MSFFRKRKQIRKERPLASAGRQVISEEIVELVGSERVITKTVCVPSTNRIAISSWDCCNRIYGLGTTIGHPEAVLRNHDSQVRDMTHLSGDFIVSVGEDGKVNLWKASEGSLAFSYTALGEGTLYSIAKIDEKRFVVGGRILVMGLGKRNELFQEKQFKAHELPVTSLSAYGRIVISASRDKTAKI